MKNLRSTILALGTLFSISSQATIVYTKIGSDISLGFLESRFDYKSDLPSQQELNQKSFCYIGDAQGVCGIINSHAGVIQGEIMNGGHEYFNVNSCEVKDGVVAASYEMKGDFGALAVTATRNISKCEQN